MRDLDFNMQMTIWGCAYTGDDLPRDLMTRWLEGDRYRDALALPLFDLDIGYFMTTLLDGERPPWRHALMPALLADARRQVALLGWPE